MKALTPFRGINPLKADVVTGELIPIQNLNRIAVGYVDDFSCEWRGRGRIGDTYFLAQRNFGIPSVSTTCRIAD
jgi:hypothetical protein